MKHVLFVVVLIAVAAVSVWLIVGSNDKTGQPQPKGEDSFSETVLGEREAEQTTPESTEASGKGENENKPEVNTQSGFRRFVWISYLDLTGVINEDKAVFLKNVETMADNLETLKTTDVFLQVRAFGDAIYPSKLFVSAGETTYSSYSADIDYLKLIIERFHERGVRVHAWLNPYRLKVTDNDAVARFCEGLSAQDSLAVIEYENTLTLNPANDTAKKLILDGVKEILDGYEVDSVHFDDYFYPTSDTEYDAFTYAAFLEEGGMMALSDFRRDAVSRLVSDVYEAVKAKDKALKFGISPDASITRNFPSHYANVQLWCGTAGYVDYICPQIYFGFENEFLPFSATLNEWAGICGECDLIAGLSFYKAGSEDIYAGSGAEEWTKSFDIIARQYSESAGNNICKGIALYRYDSIFKPAEETASYASVELYNLLKVIE